MLLILLAAGLCNAQAVYQIKDLEGRTLISTKDKALVRQFTNVKVDTILIDTIRISELKDSSYCNDLRDVLTQSLGRPVTESYHVGWILDGGAEIYLMKYFRQRPLIQYNREGGYWLRKYVVGLLEQPVETKACTTLTNKTLQERKP